MAAKFDITKDHADKFRFPLKVYETRANAEGGIDAIKTHAPNARVEDRTEAKSS